MRNPETLDVPRWFYGRGECVCFAVWKVWSRGGIISFSSLFLSYYTQLYVFSNDCLFSNKQRIFKLPSKSLYFVIWRWLSIKLNLGLKKNRSRSKSRSIFIARKRDRNENSYSNKEEEKKRKRISSRASSDRIKRLTRATRYLSTLDHRCSRARSDRSVLSPKFSARWLPTLVSNQAKRRTGYRHPPRARIPTPVREAKVLSGAPARSIGNIGIPRAAQRFRGSASFEEEARERPISSPAFQQCGFICVTISPDGGGERRLAIEGLYRVALWYAYNNSWSRTGWQRFFYESKMKNSRLNFNRIWIFVPKLNGTRFWNVA